MVSFEPGAVASELEAARQELDGALDLGCFALNIVRALDEAPGSSLTEPNATWTEALDLVLAYPGTASDTAEDDMRALLPPTRQTLRELLHVYRSALPFDEAERRWLYEPYFDAVSQLEGAQSAAGRAGDAKKKHAAPTADELRATLLATEGAVVAGGIDRAVNLGALVDRWSRWSRGDDEFAGGSGVERVRRSLLEIARFVLAEQAA